jgi:hypothetical protein
MNIEIDGKKGNNSFVSYRFLKYIPLDENANDLLRFGNYT